MAWDATARATYPGAALVWIGEGRNMTEPHVTAADLRAFAAAELSAEDLARVDNLPRR